MLRENQEREMDWKEREMDRKEREKERVMKEAQGKVIHHICHKHPLTPTETPYNGYKCFGCRESFSQEDAYAYGCIIECDDQIFLHKECAELRRKVKHSWEEHIIHQKLFRDDDLGKPLSKCGKCKESIDAGLYYRCVSCCDLTFHLRCGRSIFWSHPWQFIYDDDVVDDRMMMITHPSHKHSLRMLKRESSFRCDACGEFGRNNGSSYICILCEYWIHEVCALLPPTIKREKHHDHSLSVAYYLPHQYSKFEYSCDICGYNLRTPLWVYHCEICSYVVHIMCGLRKTPPIRYSIKGSKSIDDDKDIIQFPISDVSEELIRPFVMRGGGKIAIPCGDEITKNTPKYKFHNHPHPLRLSSSGENNIDIDDDDDDDLEHGRRSSELICDGCITPIHQKKKIPKFSSSIAQKYFYYSCDECKYFLHSACFNIPLTLPSHPLHDYYEQNLVLQTSPDLNFNNAFCSICHLDMNGLFYTCTECSFFEIDIKCASLPSVIKHASHPRHTLKLSEQNYLDSRCGVCGSEYGGYRRAYTCDHDCKFSLHLGCALLPATNEHRRDKHLLPLTYDAYVNHPGEFYCDVCEKEMNPKMWMYHCRECDQSIHPDCFPASSGQYRNIKFGHEYVIGTCHDPHHPLIYQPISRKRCCDLCREYKYGDPGFQCVCCNFVMCFDPCGKNHKYDVRAKH